MNFLFQDTVELLIKNKADLSARDKHWQTPLHVAAANNAVECVEVMLPQLLNISITDRGGRTSLHHAAYNGHHEVVLLLDFILYGDNYLNLVISKKKN